MTSGMGHPRAASGCWMTDQKPQVDIRNLLDIGIDDITRNKTTDTVRKCQNILEERLKTATLYY